MDTDSSVLQDSAPDSDNKEDSGTEAKSGVVGRQTRRRIALDGRPQWPYEDWTYETIIDEHVNGTHSTDANTKTQLGNNMLDRYHAKTTTLFKIIKDDNHDITGNKATINAQDATCSSEAMGQASDVSSEDEIIYVPNHWLGYFLSPVSSSAPIQDLINYFEQSSHCNPEDMDKVKGDIESMMQETLGYLQNGYDFFQGSSLRLVGSSSENSKLYHPDEFDFAVILPFLANETGFTLLFTNGDDAFKNKSMIALANDLADGDTDKILSNMHAVLNVIWFRAMEQNVHSLWEFDKNSKCHEGNQSVAGTYHVMRKSDKFQVSIDVSFWVPMTEENLKENATALAQIDFLRVNALDSEGLVYAMLCRDYDINYELNGHRFATSFLEREWLNKFGGENSRLRCYKLAKCIASTMIPKKEKFSECNTCLDSIVSSFILKQIVLYMIHNHPDDAMWSEDQIGNRLVEIFAILQLGAAANHSISAFFSPYAIHINAWDKYDPKCKGIVYKSGWFSIVDGEKIPEPDTVTPCILPNADPIISAVEDVTAKEGLKMFFEFMADEEWSAVKLIYYVVHTLCLLLEDDEEERRAALTDVGFKDVIL